MTTKRFANKQQMQWAPRGVHLRMQLRTSVRDGTPDSDFKRWREERRPSPNEAKMAAWGALQHCPGLGEIGVRDLPKREA